MLPYTTYNIPENIDLTPAVSDKWLWIITSKILTDEDKDFLGNISKALKAEFDQDVHCLQIDEGNSISLTEIKGCKPRLIISCGVAPSSLGLWIDLKNSGLVTLERFTFILTSPLNVLSERTATKKELWRSMQVFLEKN